MSKIIALSQESHNVIACNCVGNAVPLTSSKSFSAVSSESEGGLNSAPAHDATFMCPICGFVGHCYRTIQQHCFDVHHAEWQGEDLPLREISQAELPSSTNTESLYLENSGAITQTAAVSDCSSSTVSWLPSADGSAEMANQTLVKDPSSSSAVEHVQSSSRTQLEFATLGYDTLTPAELFLPPSVPVLPVAAYLTASQPCEMTVAQPEQHLLLAPGTELLPCQPEMVPTHLPEQFPRFQGPPPGEFPIPGAPQEEFPFQGTPPEKFPFQGPALEEFQFRLPPPGKFLSRGPPAEEFPFQGPPSGKFPFPDQPPEDVYVQLLKNFHM